MTTAEVQTLEPIFVTVADAAKALALSTSQVYRLLDGNEIRSQYKGTKRLVRVDSLKAYADALPTVREDDTT